MCTLSTGIYVKKYLRRDSEASGSFYFLASNYALALDYYTLILGH